MVQPAERFVGIDLGTTYSAIAYVDNQGQPVNITTPHGELLTPSVVQILPNRKILVGQDAVLAAADCPDRTAFNIKRDIGESFYRRPLGGKDFSPEALSALILKQLALDARSQIGNVRDAVITVPAYFGDTRRKATEDAGRIAGLKVADILNEPTAAALANAFGEFLQKSEGPVTFSGVAQAVLAPKTTLVFDLGGGTFDVTIIRIDGHRFDVLATGGEVRLGGIDFDERLLTFLADEFARRYGVDIRDDDATAVRTRHTCELAKRALSERDETIIVVEHLGRRLNLPITRAQFEELTADLVTRTQLSTEMLLEDAMLTWDRIDTVLLVGGSTRMPCIADMLTKISSRPPMMAAEPDLIVSHGAAIHAAILQMNRQATAVAVPVDDRADSPATGPAKTSEMFNESVQAAARQVQLENVNAHSLGVVVRAPRENRIVHSQIIQRNTPLPTTRTKVFGTEVANQSTVRLRVVEGESRDPSACTQIGECLIHRLPPGLPQGSPVEVTFTFDASGRLRVRAVDLTRQTVAEVEIERVSGFKPNELESMANSVTELMEPKP